MKTFLMLMIGFSMVSKNWKEEKLANPLDNIQKGPYPIHLMNPCYPEACKIKR